METFGSKVIRFNRELSFNDPLPENIEIMNPFRDNPEVNRISEAFYTKFYNDTNSRRLILGINPGRLGGGVTGIPFTDSKRLKEECGIDIISISTHEPSSVFIYDVIREYGGTQKFYSDFYIHSICPLGFIRKNDKGNRINCNYYDDCELLRIMYDFMVDSLKKQIAFGIDRKTCYVLGKKNMRFVKEINKKYNFFEYLTELEHPRYIVQYKSKETDKYLAKYIGNLSL